ncbi:MAG: hypothetical protein HQ541_04950 [Mariniphaga sp.]|nr:hypothetical protein [Mariniphaga sp.]
MPEIEFISPFENKRIFTKVKMFPIFSHEGKVINIVVIQENITNRKLAEEELAKHHENLEELVKERTLEVDEKNQKLSDQMKIFVGRELKIRDLEKKIRGLQGK